MMNFIALYRGPTVSEARLVAVSSGPGVVGRFIRELAGEADSTDDEAFVWRLWFWTQDPEQIRRIHAGSGLSRQKSTRRRDYLERSIKNAAGSGMETYDWSTSPESTRIRVGGSVATDDAYSRSLSSPGMRNEDNHSLKRSIEVVQFRGREKPAPREWLTYEEARRLVGLSPTTMWKLVTSGSVKGARVGHSVLFPRKPLPGIAMPEQQRARVLNGIARLLETERDPERLAMLEPFAVQVGLIRVVDRGWVLDFCQRPDQEEYLLDAESRFVEAETDAVFRLDAAGADYPRNDATASFIYQTLGKRKEAHIR